MQAAVVADADETLLAGQRSLHDRDRGARTRPARIGTAEQSDQAGDNTAVGSQGERLDRSPRGGRRGAGDRPRGTATRGR